MITELTEEQKSRFPEFVKRWTEIGLSTEPADRAKAEAAINDCYRAAAKEPPKRIVWCGSPLSQGITRAVIMDKKLASVGASVWDSVRDSVWDSVRDSVGASVRGSVWDSVRDSVWDSVRASVWASVGASVRDSVGASVRDSVRDSVWASGYGQHDAGWLAFYSFFRIVVGISEKTEKLHPMMDLAESAGWWLPHENICWVSERHNFLSRDEAGRLHNEAGPAVMFPDGWKIYAVHGVRLPQWIIEDPEKISVTLIDAERNAEIRRVMMAKYGWDRYLRDAGSETVGKDECGILLRRRIPDDEDLMMVAVLNSTPEPDGTLTAQHAAEKYGSKTMVSHDGMMMPVSAVPHSLRFKEYMLRVPPTVKTAKEGVAWTFDLPAEDYEPVFQS